MGQWIVDGVNIVVSRNTLINQTNGLAVVGAEVRVIGQQADAVVVARDHRDRQPVTGERVRFEGPITGLPENGLLGDWIIADQTVRVTENTRCRANALSASARGPGLGLRHREVIATNLVYIPGGRASIDIVNHGR